MLIKFVKNAYHPKKRTYGLSILDKMVYDFYEGKVYDLPDDEARYHISKGEAVQVARLVLKQPPQIMALRKALKLPAQPEDKIRIPTLTEAEIEAIRKFETSKAFREFFSNKSYGDIPARNIVGLLLKIYDHAIKTNDNNTIIKISRDLTTILKLVKILRRKND